MTTADARAAEGDEAVSGWTGRRWLNPPSAAGRDDDPACVLLSPAERVLLGELLAAEKKRLDEAVEQDRAAKSGTWMTDEEVARQARRSLVAGLAANLEWVAVPPAVADERLSREATWHPANQLSRLLPTVLVQLIRWSGGRCIVSNAVEYAAAIEASRRGWDGVADVANAAVNAGEQAVERAYGAVEPRPRRP